MGRLNPNQVRHVRASFSYVDGLLLEVDRLAADDSSAFGKETADIADPEARLLRSFTGLARARMLAALDHLGIPRPAPSLSARWSAQTTLQFADSALSELGADGLRGYGAVDDDVGAELAALASALREVVGRAIQVLHEHEAGGLKERLSHIPGRIGEVLRGVEGISSDRGLAEVRPLLAIAADRATSITFDVGVFGRVSTGKSSLINALVGSAVLPVGATPVTAVPVRLARGPAAAVVHFSSGVQREIAVDRIGDLVTEQGNPENRAGVRSVDITVPTAPEGLGLFDTPGVGSLASSGPAQAFAWLPRCDLGLVLIAAANPVGGDDLALVTGLRRAGISCLVVLSKADLMPAAELASAFDYVRRELRAALGPGADIEIRSISTAAGATASLEAFRGEVLEPLARDRARASEHALHLRLHHLISATAAALAGRRNGPDDRLVLFERARNDARTRLRQETDRLAGAAPVILEMAAALLTAAWASGEDGRLAVRNRILQEAGAALSVVTSAIGTARATADQEGIASRRIPPLFDPGFLDTLPPMPPPALGRRWIGRAVAERRLAPLSVRLAAALSHYASRLSSWGGGALDELTMASRAGVDPAPPSDLPPELARLDHLLNSV